MNLNLKQCFKLAGLEYPSQIEDRELLHCDSEDSYINRYENFLDSEYIHLGLSELSEDELKTIDNIEKTLRTRFYNSNLSKLFYDFYGQGERFDNILVCFLKKNTNPIPDVLTEKRRNQKIQGHFLPTYNQFLKLKYLKKNESVWFTMGEGYLEKEFDMDDYVASSIKDRYSIDENGYIELIKDCSIKYQDECLSIFNYFISIMELERGGVISALDESRNKVYEAFKRYIDKHGKENTLKNIYDEISLFYFKKIYLNTLIKYSDKHFYIVGMSGSGKSELLKYIFAQEHLKQKKNIILIDPHGDLSQQIAKTRILNNPKKDRALIYVDADFNNTILKAFSGNIPNKTFKDNNYFSDLPRINPLELPEKYRKDTRVIENTAKNILNAFNEIITIDRDGNDKAFSINMETLLIPCISTLLRKENSTLFDLQDFMDDDKNSELVQFGIRHCSIGQKRFFEKQFYSEKLRATKEAIYNKLQSLFNYELFIKMMCGRSTIDLEKAQKEDCRIVFRLDKKTTGGIQQALGVFITTSILNASYRLTGAQRRGTYFIIDEFQNFVTDTIEEVLSQSRKYGLSLMLAHQYSSQIRNTKVRASVSANTDIKLLGKSEAKTHAFFGEKASLSNELKENAKKLKAGQFYLFNGMNNGTLLTIPSVLIKAKRLRASEWQAFLLSQYENYYKPQTQKEEIQKPEVDKKIKYVNF